MPCVCLPAALAQSFCSDTIFLSAHDCCYGAHAHFCYWPSTTYSFSSTSFFFQLPIYRSLGLRPRSELSARCYTASSGSLIEAMADFFSGTIAMGFLIAALFFFRFWWRTNDGLFAAFALAFLLFALNQALITGIETSQDEKSLVYLLRLAGYALIISAVVRKNFRSD
jgi:hypothetical protein